MTMKLGVRSLVLGSMIALVACSTQSGPVDESTLEGASETGEVSEELSGGVPVSTQLRTTAPLNLRSGASTNYKVLHVIPDGGIVVTVNRTTPVNGFYNVKHGGQTGWAYGAYLQRVSDGGGGSSARDKAIARARVGVGFSYWWGHGRWLWAGPSSSTRGSCSGSCPSCSHSGSYGADCSGYVAKIWQVPSSNDNISIDSHPYSTWNFENESRGWKGISRSSLTTADAMVYNTNGAGHIYLYEKGDPWGAHWAYEAKGCSSGIVHNVRYGTSAYKAIRRDGY